MGLCKSCNYSDFLHYFERFAGYRRGTRHLPRSAAATYKRKQSGVHTGASKLRIEPLVEILVGRDPSTCSSYGPDTPSRNAASMSSTSYFVPFKSYSSYRSSTVHVPTEGYPVPQDIHYRPSGRDTRALLLTVSNLSCQ
ncbi:hypothetical protein PCAR4_250053 [Paraburkholderia caribensis]|nr:hypothetical protein PCAR4_250053 [Paraburkholderia caribensis]